MREPRGGVDVKLVTLRLQNFQSFGVGPNEIALEDRTFVLGPNGSGKTAVLVALARLFSPAPALRRVQPADFHVPVGASPDLGEKELWIEVDIEFEEASATNPTPSVPPFFAQMALDGPNGIPRVRIRLTATLDTDLEVDEKIQYITQVDANGEPTKRSDMSKYDRSTIEVHYLPARRDPVDHIAYTTASLLGRMLRAADWTTERADLARLTGEISASMAGNAAVGDIGLGIKSAWSGLHQGTFFKDPTIAFGRGELDGVLRQLTVTFAPAPASVGIGFERLSDGEKSLLYISLVMAWQNIAREVLRGANTAFNPDKLRPPVHVVVALEEPENSLAPHYLGRILRQLRDACDKGDVQGIVATHAPALLHRVEPEQIRFLRLDAQRTTTVHEIVMPDETDEAAKYVREAVLAYPELYFSRLVILCEGDSEEVVLPRVLAAAGVTADDASISVVPLGGRHVNHFWRLLEALEIPYVTLLDLDSGRYQGGWGRVRYAAKQLNLLVPGAIKREAIEKLPKWNEDRDFPAQKTLSALEQRGVFYSYPLDLDLMLLEAYPAAYDVTVKEPSESTKKAVLGKNMVHAERLGPARLELFDEYRAQFQLASKPASHIAAMAKLGDHELMADLPEPLSRLLEAVRQKLKSIPE